MLCNSSVIDVKMQNVLHSFPYESPYVDDVQTFIVCFAFSIYLQNTCARFFLKTVWATPRAWHVLLMPHVVGARYNLLAFENPIGPRATTAFRI